MKRIIPLALAFLCLLALTACGDDTYMIPEELFYIPDDITGITVVNSTTVSTLYEYTDPEHIEELTPILETGFPPKRGKSIGRDELPGINGGGLSAVRIYTADGSHITYYYGGSGCISADRSIWYRWDDKNFDRKVSAFVDKYRDIIPGERGNLD